MCAASLMRGYTASSLLGHVSASSQARSSWESVDNSLSNHASSSCVLASWGGWHTPGSLWVLMSGPAWSEARCTCWGWASWGKSGTSQRWSIGGSLRLPPQRCGHPYLCLSASQSGSSSVVESRMRVSTIMKDSCNKSRKPHNRHNKSPLTLLHD